jgi:uncharacterized protein (DUF1684 family)
MALETGTSAAPNAGSDLTETLQLADWRRRMADLYAEVRRLARTDPPAALELWRETRERLFREHSQSPVPEGARSGFRARHFDADLTMRFEVVVEPDDAPPPAAAGPISFAAPASLELPVSAGGTMAMRRIGSVAIPFPAGVRRLGVFWMAGYAGGLFVPFRDATNGVETYGAGRYLLDTAKSADLGGDAARGGLVLDFNFAFHPSCAFDPRWACPLAPPENRLDLPIRAGERLA